MTDEEIYSAYVRTFGKVRSGHQLVEHDFGVVTDYWHQLPEAGRVAVALGAEDAVGKSPMQAKKALLQRVRELVAA